MTGHTHSDNNVISRRSLLAGTAAGGLLIATATSALAADAQSVGAGRASRLTQGTTLVHADMHNHSILSDGDGDPAQAFGSMRAAGLDVAALTDHATLFAIEGLTRSEWDRVGTLAAAADDPGQYTAIRGFEWSHPLLGHVNVWFTANFTDLSGSSSMSRLYSWINGAGGIASFNHPGKELARFNNFGFVSSARDALVSMEIFNSGDDYLFKGWGDGATSPLNACLNAGWRTGLTGVSDHHGTSWGQAEGQGRGGLWVMENTRAGVQEALRARRVFASIYSGVRLDATANGIRMGNDLPLASGDVTFAVDFDRGADWLGKPLRIQVLRPGTAAPQVVEVIDFNSGTPTSFTVPLNVADGNWVVLRVSDPSLANAWPGPSGHPCNDFGVAYTSPWWLRP